MRGMSELAQETAHPASFAVDEVPDDLGRSLGSLLRAYLDRAALVVDALPGGPRGFQVLQVVDEAACSNQAQIASALGLDRTVMTYLVDDLERAGLVERRPDPADRRSRRVVLTDDGVASLARARDGVAVVERETLHALDDADADLLRSLLARASRGVDRHDACSVAQDPPTC